MKEKKKEDKFLIKKWIGEMIAKVMMISKCQLKNYIWENEYKLLFNLTIITQ